jgi:hypothetical protein
MTYARLTPLMIAASFFASTTAASAAPDYISGAAARAALADGKPWAMTSADGKKATFTFNGDGKGKLTGPISKSIKWTMEGDNFCIAMGMMLGTRCLRFVAIKGGYQGYVKDKPGMAFRR